MAILSYWGPCISATSFLLTSWILARRCDILMETGNYCTFQIQILVFSGLFTNHGKSLQINCKQSGKSEINPVHVHLQTHVTDCQPHIQSMIHLSLIFGTKFLGCDYSPHRATPDRTGPTPDRTGPVPGRKWLIISLWRLLRVELRHNSETTVLGLQLNKQETLNTSVTNSSRASIRVLFFSQLRIISSSYAFQFVVEVK